MFAEGRLSEAANLFGKICASDKMDADAWVMRAVIQIQLGDLNEAERLCLHTLQIDANHALAHHALGSVLERKGQLDKAVVEFRKAVMLRPGFANAHLFLANTLARMGADTEAEAGYFKVLELEPDFVQAMAGLGTFYVNTGRFSEAEIWLRRALAAQPKDAEILVVLGQSLISQGKDAEAIHVLDAAVEADPGSYKANYVLGNILTKSGRYDNALCCYRKAASIRPDDEYAIGAQAHVFERRGELDKAFSLLEPYIKSGSVHVGIVMPFAELSMQMENPKEAIGLLEQILLQNVLDLQTSSEIHYKLGKLLDNAEEYDRSFGHYKKANEITCKLVTQIQDLDAIDNQAERIASRVDNCGREFWKTVQKSGNESLRPIFIVGMPRSGTTLLEQILASHPDVYGAGELMAIEEIARSLSAGNQYQLSYPMGLAEVSRQSLGQCAARYLRQLDEFSSTAQRVVDKCPHNFMHLGLISTLFPKAHIIHIEREPLDTCTSIYFQLFTPQHAYACDLSRLAKYYGIYRKLMAHWNEVLDIPVLNIQYEQLVAEPERVTHSLVEFCDLEWHDGCLEFYATKRDVNTPSYGQVRQPIYNKSVCRWKHYKAHLHPLIDTLKNS